eukprot:TRINITY_DN68115_c0_g1_i1.p1 TRINITY_DN68115_c0_g1~~TRINITY_DN68115_c0_g1_i1.p1  ORF type:complete len:871 (-),score=236.00 TRINITY_DN68115_c0_g1_i1:146-2758(-)
MSSGGEEEEDGYRELATGTVRQLAAAREKQLQAEQQRKHQLAQWQAERAERRAAQPQGNIWRPCGGKENGLADSPGPATPGSSQRRLLLNVVSPFAEMCKQGNGRQTAEAAVSSMDHQSPLKEICQNTGVAASPSRGLLGQSPAARRRSQEDTEKLRAQGTPPGTSGEPRSCLKSSGTRSRPASPLSVSSASRSCRPAPKRSEDDGREQVASQEPADACGAADCLVPSSAQCSPLSLESRETARGTGSDCRGATVCESAAAAAPRPRQLLGLLDAADSLLDRCAGEAAAPLSPEEEERLGDCGGRTAAEESCNSTTAASEGDADGELASNQLEAEAATAAVPGTDAALTCASHDLHDPESFLGTTEETVDMDAALDSQGSCVEEREQLPESADEEGAECADSPSDDVHGNWRQAIRGGEESEPRGSCHEEPAEAKAQQAMPPQEAAEDECAMSGQQDHAADDVSSQTSSSHATRRLTRREELLLWQARRDAERETQLQLSLSRYGQRVGIAFGSRVGGSQRRPAESGGSRASYIPGDAAQEAGRQQLEEDLLPGLPSGAQRRPVGGAHSPARVQRRSLAGLSAASAAAAAECAGGAAPRSPRRSAAGDFRYQSPPRRPSSAAFRPRRRRSTGSAETCAQRCEAQGSETPRSSTAKRERPSSRQLSPRGGASRPWQAAAAAATAASSCSSVEASSSSSGAACRSAAASQAQATDVDTEAAASGPPEVPTVVPSEDARAGDDASAEEDDWARIRAEARRHLIVWGDPPELDTEDILSRAFDVRHFSFFERRDRAAIKVAASRPPFADKALARIQEYPPGWPRWRINSFELREAAIAGRRRSRRQGFTDCEDSHDVVVVAPSAAAAMEDSEQP